MSLKKMPRMRAAWKSACEFDGIPPNSKFVSFSEDNPFAPYLNKATEEYFAHKREIEAGGYVGLEIGKGQ